MISFDLLDFSSFSEKESAYVFERGDYVLKLGSSSVNTVNVGYLHLDNFVISKRVNRIVDYNIKDELKDIPKRIKEDISNLKSLSLNADNSKVGDVLYDKRLTVREDIKRLSDKDLVTLNVGALKTGLTGSVVGESSFRVAGAAGESTSKVKGFTPLVMADGPQGLRLSTMYYKDKKGVHSLGVNNIFKDMLDFAPLILKPIVKKMAYKKEKKNMTILYQQTTAIPIGTALAQSFNRDFIKECASIVKEEMEQYNVDLWLAPALNIQRSPRCGRNFEYYSEDPFLSSAVATEIVKEVESNKNLGTVIKHYAANNQEYNRYNNNSVISERTLRDIYLKGFELTIKYANPLSVMTSYNLLNGIHTSESLGINNQV